MKLIQKLYLPAIFASVISSGALAQSVSCTYKVDYAFSTSAESQLFDMTSVGKSKTFQKSVTPSLLTVSLRNENISVPGIREDNLEVPPELPASLLPILTSAFVEQYNASRASVIAAKEAIAEHNANRQRIINKNAENKAYNIKEKDRVASLNAEAVSRACLSKSTIDDLSVSSLAITNNQCRHGGLKPSSRKLNYTLINANGENKNIFLARRHIVSPNPDCADKINPYSHITQREQFEKRYVENLVARSEGMKLERKILESEYALPIVDLISESEFDAQ